MWPDFIYGIRVNHITLLLIYVRLSLALNLNLSTLNQYYALKLSYTNRFLFNSSCAVFRWVSNVIKGGPTEHISPLQAGQHYLFLVSLDKRLMSPKTYGSTKCHPTISIYEEYIYINIFRWGHFFRRPCVSTSHGI